MDFISNTLQWFTNNDQYMTLMHCMAHDMFWIYVIIFLCAAIIIGYSTIAYMWHKHSKKLSGGKEKASLNYLRNIFIFCALSSYGFLILKMWYPGWRLMAIFLMVLNYYVWKFVLFHAFDLKLIYESLSENKKLRAQNKTLNQNLAHYKLMLKMQQQSKKLLIDTEREK